jgi:hypothetical protein
MRDYNIKFKPYFTTIGWSRLTKKVNFLNHVDCDFEEITASFDPLETDSRPRRSPFLLIAPFRLSSFAETA